ncbi:hypothetical protein GCM10020255_074660 [Rhodococcus baikonurensis]
MAAHKTGTSEASSTPDGDSTSAHDAAIDTLALSSVAQDYLKVIWTIQEWSHERVSTKLLSEKMNVSASTVSEAIRKLSDQGLVDHARYGSIALTDSGRAAAVSMVRRHRLIETYLVQELGYGWDEVHDEAEVLEHAVSDLMISRMDAKLGFPERDPHGDPIPATDGSVPTPRPASSATSPTANGAALPGSPIPIPKCSGTSIPSASVSMSRSLSRSAAISPGPCPFDSATVPTPSTWEAQSLKQFGSCSHSSSERQPVPSFHGPDAVCPRPVGKSLVDVHPASTLVQRDRRKSVGDDVELQSQPTVDGKIRHGVE